MKKRWFQGFVTLLAAALIICVCMQVYAYLEKQDCICAKLIAEEQEFVIDDRLRNYYGDVEDKTGTFIRSLGQCRHGRRILLTIFPDEEIYRGYCVP